LSLIEYIKIQRGYLESTLELELFRDTCLRIDTLYRLAIEVAPALPKGAPIALERSLQILPICHKSFLAAATLIGQGQPDDAAPITRRAIEAVRYVAAIKADAAVEKEWLDYGARMKMWKELQEGRRGSGPIPSIPVKHPLVKELMRFWRIFSAADVHFTPEFFGDLKWERQGERMTLDYFKGEQRVIETAIVLALKTHMMMLRVLDDCLDGAFSSNVEWQNLFDETCHNLTLRGLSGAENHSNSP